MNECKDDTHCELSYEKPNWVISNKIYILPHMIQLYGHVEIYVVNGSCIVESPYSPIRHGKRCGSRVILGQSYGIIDRNPKFFWNGKEWHINTFGTFIFAEIELNPPESQKCF